MDPHASGVRDFSFDALGINGESLPEFVAVFTTTNHSHGESREQQYQHHREEQVVEKANPENHRTAR
jgi:hypothetical protein